jgi:hypothetical protein
MTIEIVAPAKEKLAFPSIEPTVRIKGEEVFLCDLGEWVGKRLGPNFKITLTDVTHLGSKTDEFIATGIQETEPEPPLPEWCPHEDCKWYDVLGLGYDKGVEKCITCKYLTRSEDHFEPIMKGVRGDGIKSGETKG